jgi:PAS domain S-box-containing protein
MTQSVSHAAIQLSLSVTYYLRKLLHQNLQNLKSIVAMGAAIQADEVCDINAVLTSLYFEDEELASVVSQLDRAVATHEAMASQPGQFQKERSALEEKIFWLLGYKFRSSERNTVISKGSVLVVEGDRVCADALMMDLQGQQYSVTIASSAQQALAQLDLDLPDALVVSMKLPDLSGDEFCLRLKDSNYGVIPIILVGTMDSLEEEARAFEAGAIDYLVRPFQVQELTLRLQARRQLQEFQKRLAQNNQQLQLEVEKTRRLEERSRSVFDDAVVGMFQSTAEGRYLQANRALASLYGYASPKDLIGQVSQIGQQVYVDAQRRQEFVAYMQCFKSVVAFESQVYCRDGSMIWISESVRSVFGESGEFLFYEGTVQDITDRKVLEQRFQVQYRVTEQLAQAATLLQGSQVLLREVGKLLGWERGEVWLLRSPMEVLQKVDRWCSDGTEAKHNPPKLQKDEGLPGFIWSHAKSVWIADLQQVPQLTAEERVRYWGFKSVIGVPCYHGNRFVGVVLWLSKETVELEESGLLSTIQVMTHQFAQFVGRRYAESNLRQSETRLRHQTHELQSTLSELKEAQDTLMAQEQQALLGLLASNLMRELVDPMDFVDRNLAHTEDYVHDLVALLKLYRTKASMIPELQAEIEAADAIDLDFLIQEFPKLASAIHQGVQLIHRKVESLTQAVAIPILGGAANEES